MECESPYFNYNISAIYYLNRAKEQLQLFDSGVIEGLFYGALDLRFGIEARLFEYIKASSQTLKHSNEYVATNLLRILTETNPDYNEPATIVIGLPEQNIGSRLDYTPVTKKLAFFHGKLGEMLHFKFFMKNENWFIMQRLSNKRGQKTLLNSRDFLDEVTNELQYATSGVLLSHPTFTKLMKEADEAT